ncbi:MAG: radical SAM protein [Bacteroidetes bacterium]|nr:radical SAM protein [Bacteroidota bacterium]
MLKRFFYRFKKREGADLIDSVHNYNLSRTIKKPVHLCHAPFNNMYINTEGHIAVCWMTFNNPVKYTEDKNLKEIWQSGKFAELRRHIKKNDLNYQCQTCEKHLREGNFVNVLARAYDNEYPLTDFPSIIEFELENTCNLACTMCNGMLSSVIRRDVEKLPPLVSPYGEKFLSELRDFIPHLKEARFNGGEALLIKMNYRIFDMLFELNPDIKIVVATNGTVLTAKIKDYFSRGNMHLNISIDGFTKETYESIRLRGNFDKLMANFEWFRQYCKDNDRTLCVMINPMRQNWWEMIDFLNWCNEKEVHLWFNTITRPEDQSIWNLPASELKNIYETLSQAKIAEKGNTPRHLYNYNVRTYKNLVNQQIKTWHDEAIERESKHGVGDRTEIPMELRISDYLSSGSYSTEQAKSIQDKWKVLKAVIDVRLSDEEIKRLQGSQTIEQIVYALEHQEINELIENLEKVKQQD